MNAETTTADRNGVVRPVPRGAAVGALVRRTVGANASLTLGLVLVGALVLAGLLAPVLATHDPGDQSIRDAVVPPGTGDHLLGTDSLGRDVYSRLLYGARTDLLIALGAVICPLVLGGVLGTLAGYRGGAFGAVVVGVIDVVVAFPVLVLLIALVFALGPGVSTIIIAITLVGWVAYARLFLSAVRRERVMEYVLAARTGGVPTGRVLVRHILPNVIAQPLIYAMSDAVLIIVFITTLGYLGLGVPPPAADWGAMISEAQPYFGADPWLALVPGLAILIAGLGFAMIADGLAQKLDVE